MTYRKIIAVFLVLTFFAVCLAFAVIMPQANVPDSAEMAVFHR
jgi:hypothetical protein